MSNNVETSFDALGLVGPVSRQELQRAYKRLVLKYHPDHCGDDPVAREKFHRITEAYATLRRLYDRRAANTPTGRCMRCGRVERLIRGMHERHYCAECLLGTRRRYLPLPVYRTIRCIPVIVLEAIALWAIVRTMATQEWAYALAAAAASIGALVALGWALARADRIEI